MIVTVGDLIDELELYDRDRPVALAIQPRWPMEHSIGLVAAVTVERDGKKIQVVYIGEADQTGYLPGEAAAAVF